jgi:predicted transcriptional regulator
MAKRVGELLLEKGWITKKQLREALARQRDSNQLLGKILVEMGAITRSQLIEALEEQLRHGGGPKPSPRGRRTPRGMDRSVG